MSKEYDNTNSGALFKNNKPQSDKSPTHTGTLNVGGKEYFLNAWVKESKKGEKFFSLSVKEKTGESKGSAPASSRPTTKEEISDSIPF